MKIFRGVLLLILAASILSCDAPRLNPFDPLGQDHKFAQFDGFVQTYEQPRPGIPNVKVTWKNQNVTVQTDSLGYYKIIDVPRENGTVYFEKTGFSKDSVLIEWNNKNYKRLDNILLSYTFGDLEGFIKTADDQVISKAKAFWENQKITVESNQNGYFKIENVPIRSGKIYFEKEGFKTDTLWVDWEDGKNGKTKTLVTRILQYNIGDLDGFVKTADSQHLFIAKANVRWKNLSTVSETDSNGYFKFANIPIKSGMLYFEKDGYRKDSLYVDWQTGKTKRVEGLYLAYSIGDLEGTVRTSDPQPQTQPIENVYVGWKGLNTVSVTNADGKYMFKQIPIMNGELYFQKDGFKSDTLLVQWSSDKTKTVPPHTLKYTHGDLFGYIRTNDTKLGVPNVYVRWNRYNTIAETNDQGYFKFANIPIESGILYFEKEGFKKGSVGVSWGGEKTKQADGLIEYSTGTLSGFVKKDKSPFDGIDKVKVFWKNYSILKETNPDGSYKIEGLPIENGYLYFEKNGYSPDSVYVYWGINNDIVVREMRLNTIPKLDGIEIFSTITNKYPDEYKSTRLTVQAKVSDAENDIDSVFVQCKQLNVLAPLEYNLSTKSFEREFNTAELKVDYIDEVIGKNFDIVVRDVSKKEFTLGPSILKRVISQEVATYSPKEGVFVPSKPTFTWRKFPDGFNYKYLIEIYTDEIPATFVRKSELLSKDLKSYTTSTSLSPGKYFWIIWVIDDFLNRASSKPSTFEVQ